MLSCKTGMMQHNVKTEKKTHYHAHLKNYFSYSFRLNITNTVQKWSSYIYKAAQSHECIFIDKQCLEKKIPCIEIHFAKF